MHCAMGWSTERLRAILVATALALAAGAGHGQSAVMKAYEEDAGLTSMAIAGLAQAPDGVLRIASAPGEGCTVRLRLPLPGPRSDPAAP